MKDVIVSKALSGRVTLSVLAGASIASVRMRYNVVVHVHVSTAGSHCLEVSASVSCVRCCVYV